MSDAAEVAGVFDKGSDMRTRILGLLAVGLLVGPMAANAVVVTYDFSTSVGNGYFSYDDSNITTVGAPGGFQPGGVWYSALSFVFGGVSPASSVMGVYDNYLGTSDCLAVSAAALAAPALSLCGATGLWSGTQLSNLNGRTTADFINNAIVADASGVRGEFISLTQRVPEPGTLALLGLALLGMGLTRRKA